MKARSHEYRVVWRRHGLDQKSKRYATLRGAQRFLQILGPEPWVAWEKNPDDLDCCSGYQCGCEGLTVRERVAKDRVDMPRIEYARIERRLVSKWAAFEAAS